MSRSLTALHDACELNYSAGVQTEEHNNRKLQKVVFSYDIFPSAGQVALDQEIK